MDEHIGLTARVAEHILTRDNTTQLLHEADTATGTAQRVHNILLQFPSLLQSSAAQCSVFQMAESIVRMMAKWPDSSWRALTSPLAPAPADSAAFPALESAQSPLSQLYLLALLQQIIRMRSSFTPKQQLRFDEWVEVLGVHLGESGEDLVEKRIQSVRQQFASQDPFAHLQLDPFTVPGLTHAQLNPPPKNRAVAAKSAMKTAAPAACNIPFHFLPRTVCPTCKRTQPFYCTHCYEVIHPLANGKLPCVDLSVSIDIVLHPNVHRHKSTALQTLLLVRPRSKVSVHTYPALPLYDPETTAVLFPSEGALTMRQLAAAIASRDATSAGSSPSSLPCPVRSLQRIVFLEGTWSEAQLMLAHPKLQSLMQLRLDFGSEDSNSNATVAPEATNGDATSSSSSSPSASSSPSTAFWRYQRFGSSFLSSIEAIYHTVAQMQSNGLLAVEESATSASDASSASSSSFASPTPSSSPAHLLWLFAMSYERVQSHYRQNPKLLPPLQS